jgi:hypothetical protein
MRDCLDPWLATIIDGVAASAGDTYTGADTRRRFLFVD